MKRALVSGSAFKLSMSGADVSQAAAAQLLFDGFGQYAYNGVYVAGLFPSNSMKLVGSSYTGTVNFGKTFAAPPQCIVKLIDVNRQNSRMGYYLGTANDSTGYGAGPVQVNVTTTSLTVTIPFSGSVFQSQIGFSYAAMQI